ncbi:MAG: FKBP-type peptidyl-prolyl cis-trans isomerase [Verrucomicrobiota bacterium]
MKAEETPKPESLTERVSYAYGLSIAEQLGERGVEIDLNQFIAAFNTFTEGGEPALSREDIESAFKESQEQIEKAKAAEGQKYLDENAEKEGVEVTESGLQYEVLQEGEGSKPGATDNVTVHYHGTLIDGTVFDSSVERGEPASFPLNRVIPGWTEGVQLMPVGSKFRFTIPYDLAYGERGSPPKIAPYSTLIFEVELLEIE